MKSINDENLKWYILAIILCFLAFIGLFLSATPWRNIGVNADETVTLVIEKTWDDADNMDRIRPDSVQFTVMQNNKAWRPVTLTEADGWRLEITDAPKRDNAGNLYDYNIVESVPDGYDSHINSTTPDERTDFTVRVFTNIENPTVGEDFQYIVEVVNNSDNNGTLNVALTLDGTVSVSDITDGGALKGNTVNWTALPIAYNGTKRLAVTAVAGQEKSLYAEARATIGANSAVNDCTISAYEPDPIPEIRGFEIKADNNDINVEQGNDVTVMYTITITGDEGANYVIEPEEGLTFVRSNSSGTIGKSHNASFIVSKTVNAASIGTMTVNASALLKAGPDTVISDGVNTSINASKEVTVTRPLPSVLTVTWVDEYGNKLATNSFNRGEEEPVLGWTPVKPATLEFEDAKGSLDATRNENGSINYNKEYVEYVYTFREWIRSVDEDGNITYKASYDREPKSTDTASYRVEYYSALTGEMILPAVTRTDIVGRTVAATESDLKPDGYFFASNVEERGKGYKNITYETLKESGTVLRLYFDYFDETSYINIRISSIKNNGDGTISYTMTVENGSDVDMKNVTLILELDPIDNIELSFSDFKLDGEDLIPSWGGSSDLHHEFDLFDNDDNPLLAGSSHKLTWTLSYKALPGFAGGTISPQYRYEYKGNGEGVLLSDSIGVHSAADDDNVFHFSVINTHKPVDRMSASVTTTWDDANDADGIRPPNFNVVFKQNGKVVEIVTLSEDNNWTAEVDDLFVTNPTTGTAYSYSVEEENVPDGYTVNIVSSGQDYIITNTHVPAAKTYTVTFNAGNGSFSGSKTMTQAVGEGMMPVPPVPAAPDGYTFVGWNPEIRAVTGDVTYTAVYEKHEHAGNVENIMKEPTCTEPGSKGMICTGCSEIFDIQETDPLGHDMSGIWVLKNTNVHKMNCIRCGYEETEPHLFSDWITSADERSETRTCMVCNYSDTRAKDLPRYTVSYDPGDGTFTGSSETVTKYDYAVVAGSAKPASDGQHFAGWEYNGTVYQPGDNVEVTNDIVFKAKYAAHDYELQAVEPACTEDGYTQNMCKVCGYETNKEIIPATGHKMSDKWTDPCAGEDAHCSGHEQKCLKCGYTETEAHIFGEWSTETKDGQTMMERTCECGHKQYVKVMLSCSAVYNGKARPITKAAGYEPLKTNLLDYDLDITYMDKDGFYVGGDPKDAGEYTAVIKVMQDGGIIGSVDVDYEIGPAVLTARYISETISTDGTFKGTVEVDGFMHDDTDMPDFEFPDIDVDDIDWSKPGTYTLTPYGGKVNSNYVFEYVPGTLTIVEEGQAAVIYPVLNEDPTKPLIEKTDVLDMRTTVTVDLDGGTWEPEDYCWQESDGGYFYTLKKNDKVTLYDNPVKNGNLFMGWEKSMTDGNVTYTAHWGEISVENIPGKVYNGEGQMPEITVIIHGAKIGADQFEITDYRMDGESLGTDEQDDPVRPKDAGAYEIEIAIKDALSGPVCVMTDRFIIKPAPLTVKTESATKTYDGEELTAGGVLIGLMNSDKADLKVTGSQTEVGSSTNTYEIEWGNANPSNYEVTKDLGTLTVEKADEPGTDEPGTDEPGTDEPGTDEPGTDEPGTDTTETVDITVKVAWSDVRDYDKIRPKTINISIYQNGNLYQTKSTDADHDWVYTFRVNKADEDGKAYAYTVNVPKIRDGYEAEVNGYEITLKHVPVISMDITVNWNDKNNKDGVRPDEAELVIYQNGKTFRTVKALKKDGWKLSVKDLPKFDADYKEYSYTLGYDKVPDGYTVSLEGLAVTYTHEVKAVQATQKPSVSTTSKPLSTTVKPSVSGNSADKKTAGKAEIVKTGENTNLCLGILGLVALSGAGFAIYWDKRNKK